MKFQITGKGDTKLADIKGLLDIFVSECKKQYTQQIKGNKVLKATRYIQKVSPVPVNFNFSDELFIVCYEENNSIILQMPAPVPVKFLEKQAAKSMKKNLEGFFKLKDINVDVEIQKEKM